MSVVDDKLISAETKSQAMESLVILALGEGSLQRILSLIALAVKNDPGLNLRQLRILSYLIITTTAIQDVGGLRLVPTLRRLSGWQIHQTLSALSRGRPTNYL